MGSVSKVAVMTDTALVNKVKDIASNYKTLYVYACFGSPMTQRNKERYTNNCDYNRQPSRKAKILAASTDTFGFDCVNMIKGVLWGWNGNVNATYGGAVYASNGVPDTNANGMFQDYCYNKSNDFSNIVPGEFVWMNGHIGVYVGDNLVVECTPIWKDGVQFTGLGNRGGKSGYNNRTWTSHGKSKFIEYGSQPTPTPGFLPERGYYRIGDCDDHVEMIDNFLASKTLGNYFGTYTKFAVQAFQHEFGLEEDGNIGPITLGKMKEKGLNRYINLPSRGYFKVGDSGDAITQIDAFLAARIRGNYYGNYTSHSVMALQTIGKAEGHYDDVIDGNFGPKTLACAEYYGFTH